MRFNGLYTALITPFTREGALDVDGLIELIRLQSEANVAGIVVLGTTGESPTLDHAERKLIVKTAVEHSKVPVLVGTGTNDTRTTLQNTQEAEMLGASGALIITPYYNKPTPEGLFQHFSVIHEGTNLPIMLYNNPSRCSLNMSPETIMRLASLERVVAVKEASGSLSQLSDIIALAAAQRPDFAVLTGDDAMLLPSVALGAVGLVSVLSNLYPAEIKAFMELCLQGNMAEARVQHYRWKPIIKAIFAETNPVLVKAAMNMLGLPAGECRLPLCGGSVENLGVLNNGVLFLNAKTQTYFYP